MERRANARAGASRDRAPRAAARRHGAARLARHRARVSHLPRSARRRLHRAAEDRQGGRACAGSLLARAEPEQAAHRRAPRHAAAAHRHRLPPRSPRHRPEQLSRDHPPRRRRRGARRAAPASAAGPRRLRLRDRRLDRDAAARSNDRASRSCASDPWTTGRPRVVGALFIERETAQVVRMAFNFTRAAFLDRQLEDLCDRARERAGRAGASGSRAARRSRSGDRERGSTFRCAGSSAAGGRSAAIR